MNKIQALAPSLFSLYIGTAGPHRQSEDKYILLDAGEKEMLLFFTNFLEIFPDCHAAFFIRLSCMGSEI